MAQNGNGPGNKDRTSIIPDRESDDGDRKGPGIEEAVESANVESSTDDSPTDRIRQMQNADDSDGTESVVGNSGASRNSAEPEVGLPSGAETRSDEL